MYCFATDSWARVPTRPEYPEHDASEELDGYLNELAEAGDWSSLRAIRDEIISLLDQTAKESETDDGHVE